MDEVRDIHRQVGIAEGNARHAVTPRRGFLAAGAVVAAGALASAAFIPSGPALASGTYSDFDVKSYGALGNGTSDDTSSIQSAINAASAAGGIVYFPPGTYLVSSTLTVLSPAVTITGSGRKATVILSSSSFANGDILKFSGVQIGAVSNLTIAAGTARSGGAGIRLYNSREINICDVNMDKMFIGCQIDGTGIQVYVTRGYYTNFAAGGTGLWINTPNGNDQFIRDLVIWNDATSAAQRPNHGIRITNSQAVWMDSIDSLQCKSGLTIDPPAGGIITWFFISNSAFDTCSNYGINITPASGSICRGIYFSQSWAATTANGPGCNIQGPVQGVQFIGTRFVNNGGDGLTVTSTPTDVLLDACFAAGNAVTTSSASGVTFAANSANFAVRNSTIGARGGFGGGQAAGISIGSGAGGYVITGNDLRGNTVSMIDSGGTYKVVANNLT